jgi:DNA polymerase III subunit delta'
MANFDEIVGQKTAIQVLEKAVNAAHSESNSHDVTHAWLFVGPAGSGRSNLALAFASSLVCPNHGCGLCSECLTVSAGTHPDVEVLNAEGISIKVDEIRELISRASWGASVSKWRIVVIEDSDRMTESAANALLKALEEPGSQTVWILCAPSLDDVLPTIRSRCRLITLQIPRKNEIAKFLSAKHGISEESAKTAATISQGHIGRAKQYAGDEGLLGLRKKVLQLFLSISSESDAISVANQLLEIASTRAEISTKDRDEVEESALHAIVKGAKSGFLPGGAKALKDLERNQKARTTRTMRDEIDTFLLWLQSFIRDCQITTTENELINPDLSSEIAELRKRCSQSRLQDLAQNINGYRTRFESNAAQLLTLESLTLGFLSTQNGR